MEAGAAVTGQSASPLDLGDQLRHTGPVGLRARHYLALRADVVGSSARESLFRFGDHVPPLPWPEIAPAAARALGTDLSEVFGDVQPTAAWSNAITQTHRGRLADGTPVLIKLVRPGAADEVAQALPGLRSELPALLQSLGSEAEPTAVIDDMATWLLGQTDLTREATNLERMRAVAGEDQWESIPTLAANLSNATVLVTGDLAGIRVGDFGARWTAAGSPAGIQRARLARVPVMVLLREALRHRRFCADWHPDTVIALPGDRITFADWSLVAELDLNLADELRDYLTALFDGDVDLSLSPPANGGDTAAFRRELLDFIRAQPTVQPPVETMPNLALLEQVNRLSARHGIDLPAGARVLFDAVVCAGTTARAVDPSVDCDDVARRSLRAIRLGSKIRRLGPDATEELVAELTTLAADLPGQLHRVLSDLADGSFSLNVWTSEAAQAEHSRNRRTRALIGAIVAVALSLLLTAHHLPRIAGVSVAWGIGAALVVTYGWLAVQWRRLR